MKVMKKRAIVAAVGLAVTAGASLVHADAILFPLVQNGNGMSTFIQTANTATIVPGGVLGATNAINTVTSGSYAENLRFVFNYGTGLVTSDGKTALPVNTGNGIAVTNSNGGLVSAWPATPIGSRVYPAGTTMNNSCTHIDHPGGTSDKDTMLFSAVGGTGTTLATQLLPDAATWGAEKSYANMLIGTWYGSLAVTNAWNTYGPNGINVWAGVNNPVTGGANEGTLFGQAYVVDAVNGTMFSYNALNDPLEATTPTTAQFPGATNFASGAADQFLMTWAPNYGGTVNQSYWMFPLNGETSYTSTASPSEVAVAIGYNAVNGNQTYNSALVGQAGWWKHNEEFVSGITIVYVPCGGAFMPVSALMSIAQWDIVKHTGGVAFADVLATRYPGADGLFNNADDTAMHNSALIWKQTAVAGNKVISVIPEPGVSVGVIAGNGVPNIGAGAKIAGSETPVQSYFR